MHLKIIVGKGGQNCENDGFFKRVRVQPSHSSSVLRAISQSFWLGRVFQGANRFGCQSKHIALLPTVRRPYLHEL